MSLKYIDSLKNVINRTIKKYVNNRSDEDKLFLIKQYNDVDSYFIKDFHNSNDITDLELKKISTKFVTDEYFNSSESLEVFAIFCYEIFSHFVEQYCVSITEIYKDLEPDNLENKIKVFMKGGNVLNAIFFKNNSILPFYLRKKIIDEYSSYFNPSDFDFEIIISNQLSKKKENNDKLYQKIYSDLSHLLYFILNDIRQYFQRFELDIFDYSKYNNLLKKKLLNKLKDKINDSEYNKTNNFYLCKLVHNNLYVEEPCINDVRFIYENQYDHIVQPLINSDGSKGNKVISPIKFIDVESNKVNDYYISMNNSLDFKSGIKRSKFFLARLKSLFNFYFMEKLEWSRKYNCCYFKKIGGELIDIVINHKDSTDSHKVEDLQELQIKDKKFLAMNEKMLIQELHDIIFINFVLPWYQTKSTKRLKRYFSFTVISFIDKFLSNEFILDFTRDNINNILITFDKILNSRSPLYFTEYGINILGNPRVEKEDLNYLKLIYDVQRNLPSLFKKISDEIKKINSKDQLLLAKTEKDINKNLKEFIQNWKENFLFFLKIIESIKLGPNKFIRNSSVTFKRNKYLINYNQTGGFNSCNTSNKDYVLPTILKYFNKFTNTRISDTSVDSLRSLFQEIFQKIKNPGMFQSMIKYGDNPIPQRFEVNYTVSITFFVFLSFIVEYFLFIIVYQNEFLSNQGMQISFNYNTLNQSRNNYNNIWKEVDNRNNQNLSKKIYRKNLENLSVNELLSEFCLDLDRLFYRFMVTIIFNLEIKTNKKIKELKKNIFPPNILRRKTETTESKYEYIYPDWKVRIKDFTGISDIDLNNIIKKSLQNITDQTSKIDNEYIPDATGFFSWMYLVPARIRKERNDQNTALKFGSCITNTYLEIYLLIRINEDPSNVGVGLESNGRRRHKYWVNTQNELQSPDLNSSIAHWFTIWADRPNNIELFREAPQSVVHHLSKDALSNRFLTSLNIKDNPKKMIKALILPIFDSYREYCRQNADLNNKLRLIDNLIRDFISDLNSAYP